MAQKISSLFFLYILGIGATIYIGREIHCLLYAGFLTKFIILLDALTNTYLGSRKSKDGGKPEPIKKYIILGTALSPFLLLREPK